MTPISVVIITFNEEKNIGDCLASVKEVADEIIVVDSFSTDQTKSICEQLGAKVIQQAFLGHIGQKNFALSHAAYSHVLSLDADERLSEGLKQSIISVKSNWKADGYYMNRLSNFCGTWIRHSGWYPDRKLRLFNKEKGKWGGTNPHDKFEMQAGSSTARIRGDLLHYTAASETEYRHKMERYATIASLEMMKKKQAAGTPLIYVKSAGAFLRSYFLRLGFLDGKMGWKVSKISAWYTCMKYEKLKLLNQQSS